MGLYRLRAVLGLKPSNYPHLLDRSETVYSGLYDNPTLFLIPNPALPVLLLKIQDFTKAQQKVGTRTKGAAQARDLAAASLITSLETARSYVQELADAGTPEQAANLIKAAGLLLGHAPAHTKPLLRATQSHPSALVHLVANVGVLIANAKTKGKVFFHWGYSDDGGKTWLVSAPTPHGRTDLAGLAPLTTYGFRVGVNDKKGPGDWSQVLPTHLVEHLPALELRAVA